MVIMIHRFSAAQVRDLWAATQVTDDSDMDYDVSSDCGPSENEDNGYCTGR